MMLYISEEDPKIVKIIKKGIQKYSMESCHSVYLVEKKDQDILNSIDIFILGHSKIDDGFPFFIKKIRYINPIAKIIIIGLGNEQARRLINEGATPDGFIDRQSLKEEAAESFQSLLAKICAFSSSK